MPEAPFNKQKDISSENGTEYDVEFVDDAARSDDGEGVVRPQEPEPVSGDRRSQDRPATVPALISYNRRPRRYKGRLFAVRHNFKRKADNEAVNNVAWSYDYEQKYPEDPYGEEAFPEARVWKVYNEEAAIYDMERIEAWRDALDVLLVFIGLFSAIVTTFVVQTSQTLQPDYAQVSAILTWEVLRAIANSSSPNPVPVFINFPDPRTATAAPSRTDKLVNTLWFASLTLGLSTGLITVLVKQWLYHYTKSLSGTSRERARVRQFRNDGLERYGVAVVIDMLPIALLVALALFMAGLAIFLFPLQTSMFGVVVGIAGTSFGLYVVSVILPIADPQCPYHSPFTSYLYLLVRYSAQVRVRCLSSVASLYQKLVPSTAANDESSSGDQSHSLLIGDSLPTSLAEEEKLVVAQRSAQLDADSLVWLCTSSSNSTVRKIGLEAFAGLAPSDINAKNVIEILEKDLLPAVERCSTHSTGSRFNPIPGLEKQHDRLLRAMCTGYSPRVAGLLGTSVSSEKSIAILEQDSGTHFRLAVLPWFGNDWSDRHWCIAIHFQQPSGSSETFFPLPVWASLVGLARIHQPLHPIIVFAILSRLCLPVNDNELGAVTFDSAIQSPFIRKLALEYLGITDSTASSQMLYCERYLSSILRRRRRELQQMFSPFPVFSHLDYILPYLFRRVASLRPSGTIWANETASLRHILRDFLTCPYADKLSWETMSLGLDLWNHPSYRLTYQLATPATFRRILIRFYQSKEPTAEDLEWNRKAFDSFSGILMMCLDSTALELTKSVFNTIVELDMIPRDIEDREETSRLRLLWSPEMCGKIIGQTSALQASLESNMWFRSWMAYIHEFERLLFLVRQIIPLLTPRWGPISPPFQQLADLAPHSLSWPTLLQELLSLFRDKGYLRRIDEYDQPIGHPRRIISMQLSYLKDRLDGFHDMSHWSYCVPQFNHSDVQLPRNVDYSDRTNIYIALSDSLSAAAMRQTGQLSLTPSNYESRGTSASGVSTNKAHTETFTPGYYDPLPYEENTILVMHKEDDEKSFIMSIYPESPSDLMHPGLGVRAIRTDSPLPRSITDHASQEDERVHMSDMENSSPVAHMTVEMHEPASRTASCSHVSLPDLSENSPESAAERGEAKVNQVLELPR